VIIGLAVTALGFGLLGLSGDLLVLLVLSAVSGLGAGLVNPGQQATVADVIGADRSGGSVLAAFQMAQDSGAIVGPILIGVVADQAGFGWALAGTALVSLLALLPWLTAEETLPEPTDAVH
jgi:MFS family permease